MTAGKHITMRLDNWTGDPKELSEAMCERAEMGESAARSAGLGGRDIWGMEYVDWLQLEKERENLLETEVVPVEEMKERITSDLPGYVFADVKGLALRANGMGILLGEMSKKIGKNECYFQPTGGPVTHGRIHLADLRTLCRWLKTPAENYYDESVQFKKGERTIRRPASERIEANIGELRDCIKKKGYMFIEVEEAIGRNKGYFGQISSAKTIVKDDLEAICKFIGEDPNRFTVTKLGDYPIEMRTEPKGGNEMGAPFTKKEFIKKLSERWGNPLEADACWDHYERRNWKTAGGKAVKTIRDCAYAFEYYNENLAAAAVKNGFDLGNGNPFADELYAKRDAEKAKDAESANDGIEDLRDWCDTLQKACGIHAKEINTLSEKLKGTEDELQKRDAEIERLNGELSDLRERLVKAEKAVESLEYHYKSSQHTLAKQIQRKANQLRTAAVWKVNSAKRSANG